MLVTNKAPDFTATAVLADNQFADFQLSKNLGKNGAVLFFWPKDFTFVCPSEIIAFDKRMDDFLSKGFNVIGVSTDSEFVHLAWKNTPIEKGGIGQVRFPMVADLTREISASYDVIFGNAVALRGSFLIDRDMVIRHAVVNDFPLGRNVDEMIRMVDALLFFEENGEVCPAGWVKGAQGMKPSTAGVAEYLAQNAGNL